MGNHCLNQNRFFGRINLFLEELGRRSMERVNSLKAIKDSIWLGQGSKTPGTLC